jgi:hypothetical protein
MTPSEGAGDFALRLELDRLARNPKVKPVWLEEPQSIAQALATTMETFRRAAATIQASHDFTEAGKARRLRAMAADTAAEIQRIITPLHGYDAAIAQIRRTAHPRAEPKSDSERLLERLLEYFRQAEIRATLQGMDPLELKFLGQRLARTGEDDETLRALAEAPTRLLDPETLDLARQALGNRDLPEETRVRIDTLLLARTAIRDAVQALRHELQSYGLPADDPVQQMAGGPDAEGEAAAP